MRIFLSLEIESRNLNHKSNFINKNKRHMKNLQKNTLKRILEGEQFTISKLADVLEINRSTLSQLLNNNKQLTENNWSKITEAYPEHVQEVFDNTSKKTVEKINDKEVKFSKPVAVKVEAKIGRFKNTYFVAESSKKSEDKKEPSSVAVIEQPPLTKEQKEVKTKEENRHRNLNCPDSGYHMKVPYRDLLRARPLCPLTQLPMMLKEEIKKYKSLDEAAKKTFIASLNSSINLLG